MLPYSSSSTQTNQLNEYIFRIFSFGQLNLTYAFTQHLLLLTQPVQFYKQTKLHKTIKSIYWRDDPSFNTVQLLLLLAVSTVWCIVFGLTRNTFSLYNFFRNTVGVVLIEYLAAAFVIAYVVRYAAERYMSYSNSTTEISYAYALDIHFNAMTFVITILGVVQLLALPVIYIAPSEYTKLSFTHAFMYTGAANLLYCVALTAYTYITWLGYALLTTNTQFKQVLYYGVAIVQTLSALATLFNWNMMLFTLSMYYDLSAGADTNKAAVSADTAT